MLNMKVCPYKHFLDEIGDKDIICFGAGQNFDTFIRNNRNLTSRIIGIIDNNDDLNGTIKEGIPVYSADVLVKRNIKNFILIITSLNYCRDIVTQLDKIDFFDKIDCYVNGWNMCKSEKISLSLLKGEQKIPKVIHYCWFGKNPIPEYLQKYIDSWEKYCPDYEIIRWDENNYDITKNKYMLQAYEKKKYGFVPDYARLDIVREHGGIYLDTDVELIKNLDELLSYEFYCGFDNEKYVNLGSGFGAIKGHSLLSDMIEMYNDLEFVKDGVINYTASPVYQSKIIEKAGFILNGKYQEKAGCGILSRDAFAPGGSLFLPDEITGNTFSIHHYDASWVEDGNIKKKRNQDVLALYKERILKKDYHRNSWTSF